MSSVVEICNLALSSIRAGSINSLDEASLPAQQCKLKYNILLDQALRDAPWQFARKIRALALRTDELFNWRFAYQYPSDCLQINRVMLNFENVDRDVSGLAPRYRNELRRPNFRQQVEYQLQNIDGDRVIAANEEELYIEYRARVTDPNLYDPQFIMAFSHLLAAELAVPIVGTENGRAVRADEMTLYDGYIRAATASDLNEQYYTPPDSEYVNVRN